MKPKNKNNEAKKWLIYFLMSIPMAILLKEIIEHKYKVLFWMYMAMMGISAFIARWFQFEAEKNKFVKIAEHICFVCVITMFLWYFAVMCLL